jgi:hypothetical protein
MPKDIYWKENEDSKPILVGSIRIAKKLLKERGGKAWIEYCDRDGTLLEVQYISLKGRNKKDYMSSTPNWWR